MKRRSPFTPVGHLGTKRMGELAEIGFMYRAAGYGIGVAKPYGDSFPYDFLTQHGKRLLRVQVKSCFSSERHHKNGFPIIVSCHWGRGRLSYRLADVDFIAAFVAKYDAWYLIPMESLGERKNIRVYPGKRKPNHNKIRNGQYFGKYEQYREAWHLLRDENYSEKLQLTSLELSAIVKKEAEQEEMR